MARNFHVPLPEQTYQHLRAAAEQAHVPATVLAREAIDSWLRQQARNTRAEAIADYANQAAGTNLDLDRQLEAAAVDYLRKTMKPKK